MTTNFSTWITSVLLCLTLIAAVTACNGNGTEPIPPPPPTLTLPDLQVTDCSAVEVPLIANNIDTIITAGVELHIEYDSTHITCDSVKSEFLSGALVNASGSILHVIWEGASNPVTITNADTLVLIYISDVSGTGDLTFAQNTEVVDVEGTPLNLEFVDGSVECIAP